MDRDGQESCLNERYEEAPCCKNRRVCDHDRLRACDVLWPAWNGSRSDPTRNADGDVDDPRPGPWDAGSDESLGEGRLLVDAASARGLIGSVDFDSLRRWFASRPSDNGRLAFHPRIQIVSNAVCVCRHRREIALGRLRCHDWRRANLCRAAARRRGFR